MLFQGEEFAASTPFQFFADHDPEIAKLVSAGRKKEFAAFGWDPGQIPDPEDPRTFERSKLNWDESAQGKHAEMLDWYTKLIHIRRSSPSLNDGDTGHIKVRYDAEKHWIVIDRGQVEIVANLGPEPAGFDIPQDYRIVAQSHTGIALTESRVTLPSDTLAILSCEQD
jgi:maltooligosyltrehalose trehalohydrolase